MVQNTEKYTVITGASSGIGYETAKAFAERGSSLILVARRKDRLETLRQEILALHPMLDIVVKAADLTVPQNVFQLYESIESYSLRTWVNNAGFGNYGSVGNQDLEKISRMLHLNVEALTVFSSLFVRDFKDTEGTQLINISSCGGYTIVPNAVTYCAAKFYVSAFTEGLAWELKAAHAKMQAKVLAPAAKKRNLEKLRMTSVNMIMTDYLALIIQVHRWRHFCLNCTTATKRWALWTGKPFHFICMSRNFNMQAVHAITRKCRKWK